MKNKYPRISIVVATYNSEKTLALTLDSIKKQNYLSNKIEVLIVDGGSTDQTLKIAKKNKCRIIPNPKREPVPAKHIGYLNAKGKYIMYLDSDEVLNDYNSVSTKIDIFNKYANVKAIIPAGYKTPKNYSLINYYINEFGDPFSFFIYNLSKDYNYLIKELKKRYQIVVEEKSCVIFDFSQSKSLPIVELIAMASMIDGAYFKLRFPEIIKNSILVPHFFYLLNNDSKLLAVAKNDTVTHYSADTIDKYLKKIKSRVKNNIYHTTMGEGGFSGRNQFQPYWIRFKRYLFIPYSISIIFPLIDSLLLYLTRKKAIYFIHPFLCLYTAFLIVYYYGLKMLGIKSKIKGYGV